MALNLTFHRWVVFTCVISSVHHGLSGIVFMILLSLYSFIINQFWTSCLNLNLSCSMMTSCVPYQSLCSMEKIEDGDRTSPLMWSEHVASRVLHSIPEPLPSLTIWFILIVDSCSLRFWRYSEWVSRKVMLSYQSHFQGRLKIGSETRKNFLKKQRNR